MLGGSDDHEIWKCWWQHLVVVVIMYSNCGVRRWCLTVADTGYMVVAACGSGGSNVV